MKNETIEKSIAKIMMYKDKGYALSFDILADILETLLDKEEEPKARYIKLIKQAPNSNVILGKIYHNDYAILGEYWELSSKADYDKQEDIIEKARCSLPKDHRGIWWSIDNKGNFRTLAEMKADLEGFILQIQEKDKEIACLQETIDFYIRTEKEAKNLHNEEIEELKAEIERLKAIK